MPPERQGMAHFHWPKRCLRLVGWALLAWTLAAAGIAFAGLRTKPAHADLALVLGNTVTRTNRPMPRLEARLEAARALYARGGCATIMVSGGIDRHDLRNEAAGMKQWLIERGIPSADIVEDPYGNNTRASAQHARDWLIAHHQRSAVVVSQYFHLPRARLALRQAGVIDAGGDFPRRWFARDAYSSFREAPGYLAYWLRLDQSRSLAPIREAGR
jgi:vancomycin permeability regulator SanA